MAGAVDWRRVAKTALHPTQVEILDAMAARERLSPVQFCSNGDEPLSRIAYHFRALRKVGLLEPAGTKQRRGATEHYYRLSRDALD